MTIAVIVERGERLGKLLYSNARAHEAIKRDSWLSSSWVTSSGRWSRCRPFYVYEREL